MASSNETKAAAAKQVQRFTGCGRFAAESIVESLADNVATEVAALADCDKGGADKLQCLVADSERKRQEATAKRAEAQATAAVEDLAAKPGSDAQKGSKAAQKGKA